MMSVEYVNKQRRVQNNLSSHCEIAIIKKQTYYIPGLPSGKNCMKSETSTNIKSQNVKKRLENEYDTPS